MRPCAAIWNRLDRPPAHARALAERVREHHAQRRDRQQVAHRQKLEEHVAEQEDQQRLQSQLMLPAAQDPDDQGFVIGREGCREGCDEERAEDRPAQSRRQDRRRSVAPR